MYTPSHFRNDNTAAVKDFIKQNGFGILVSGVGNLLATHLPLEIAEDGTTLTGHLARANPQCKSFSTDSQVLAIFSGPHAYISSSWYVHETVPTWNYIAAHVYGKLRIIEGEELYEALKKLIDKYEVNSINPTDIRKMDGNYIKHAMQGIVGFEIAVDRIESSFKLSQDRDAESYKNILHELGNSKDEGSLKVMEAMKKIKQ